MLTTLSFICVGQLLFEQNINVSNKYSVVYTMKASSLGTKHIKMDDMGTPQKGSQKHMGKVEGFLPEMLL